MFWEGNVKNEKILGNLGEFGEIWGNLRKNVENEQKWETAGNGKQMQKHTGNVAILPTCGNMANARFDVHHFPGECSILRRPHVHTCTALPMHPQSDPK